MKKLLLSLGIATLPLLSVSVISCGNNENNEVEAPIPPAEEEKITFNELLNKINSNGIVEFTFEELLALIPTI